MAVTQVVASGISDPLFESSHRQILFSFNCVEKIKGTKPRGREWPLLFSKVFFSQMSNATMMPCFVNISLLSQIYNFLSTMNDQLGPKLQRIVTYKTRG